MDNPNLEFIVDKDRDSDSLDNIRIKLFNCLLNSEEVNLQKNINFFNNTILLSFLNDNNNIRLEKKEKELFLKFLDMFHPTDIFVTCDKDYMNYMKIIFNNNIFTVLRNKFMYCKGLNLSELERNLITKTITNLGSQIGYYKDYQEINNILNLKNLKKVKINTLEDISKIFEGKENSNYYLLENELDKININRLKESKLLQFNYINNSVTSKYYLLRCLLKVGMETNLPTFSLRKILENLNHPNFLETVGYQVYLKIVEAKIDNIKSLKIKKFSDLEKALAYNIKLAEKEVHGIMILHHHQFNICYISDLEIELGEDLVKESKDMFISKFSKEEIEKYKLESRDLYFLTNIISVNERELILPDMESLFTEKGNPVSVQNLENRNLYCYNVFNDLFKLEKNNFGFDRNKINIDVDIDIDFMEKIDFIYSLVVKNTDLDVVLKKDIFIDGDVEIIENKIRKLWKKGYFLTDYAIYRYGIMGIIKNQDIKFPEWFHSTDSESYRWLMITLDSL